MQRSNSTVRFQPADSLRLRRPQSAPSLHGVNQAQRRGSSGSKDAFFHPRKANNFTEKQARGVGNKVAQGPHYAAIATPRAQMRERRRHSTSALRIDATPRKRPSTSALRSDATPRRRPSTSAFEGNSKIAQPRTLGKSSSEGSFRCSDQHPTRDYGSFVELAHHTTKTVPPWLSQEGAGSRISATPRGLQNRSKAKSRPSSPCCECRVDLVQNMLRDRYQRQNASTIFHGFRRIAHNVKDLDPDRRQVLPKHVAHFMGDLGVSLTEAEAVTLLGRVRPKSSKEQPIGMRTFTELVLGGNS
eukprot:TRINITY_DN81765_c0_g1_i1.p1 TRINITY_DN81765_c0_g1~~TRINITY_DN81765_c0_g1_i1.p1  ORF type:complete len:301 (+),score=36.23 TRINITY_DN81765_c0_g1_i1:99-1001(+)